MSDKKNLCMLPWVHLHTWPNGTVYPCCVTPMNYKAGNLNDNTLEEVYNSDLMKDIRVKMINEERHDACSRCWLQEDQGGMSMRHRANKSWTEYEHMIDDTKEDGTVEEMKLPYWDFRFSNICNFKCRSCGPQLSTGWYTEIYFAGGEPLIMEEHYRILKKLDAMGKHDVLLRYNTNFSEMRYKDLHVLEFWPKFKNVEVGASIDGMQEQGEFIRSGFNWEQFKENRNRMKETCSHVNFYVSSTISIQNAYHVVPFHHALVDGGYIDSYNSFNVNIVTEPPWLDTRILPDHHKQKLVEVYNTHIDFLSDKNAWATKQGFEGLRNHVSSELDPNTSSSGNHYPRKPEGLRQLFKYKMEQLDEIRKESFSETFPELEDLYDAV